MLTLQILNIHRWWFPKIDNRLPKIWIFSTDPIPKQNDNGCFQKIYNKVQRWYRHKIANNLDVWIYQPPKKVKIDALTTPQYSTVQRWWQKWKLTWVLWELQFSRWCFSCAPHKKKRKKERFYLPAIIVQQRPGTVSESEAWVQNDYSGANHPLGHGPVIKLGVRHPRKREKNWQRCERPKEACTEYIRLFHQGGPGLRSPLQTTKD